MAVGAIWNLQALGRGYAILGSVSDRAKLAYEKIISAKSAMAESNFIGSEQEFSDAADILNKAREDLSGALSASKVILEVVDLTGVVKSGDKLLGAAEAVTQAGQHIARGLAPLTEVQVKADASGKDKYTLVEALEITRDQFTTAKDDLEEAERKLADVNAAILPREIKQQVETIKTIVPKVQEPIAKFLEESDLLLTVLGDKRDRQYLLLFQNNHEMRPTGGFIGSVALVNVKRGVVENIDVKTVYDPDGQLKEFIAPPEPLRIITDRWYMRDANWFADYAVSAQKIATLFEKEGGPTVDGVIAMTPEVIKDLLAVTGPIEVPGYDITVDENNFVALTQDQVTYSYDRKENKPKQFLADLTPILMNKLTETKSAGATKLLGALSASIREKQMLMYLRDEDEQSRIGAVGWSGIWPKDKPGFLSVVNANIGGHKSDQFIEQEVDYRSDILASGDVEVTVTIKRTHHGPEEKLDYPYPSNEDPAFKDNIVHQRVFVPKGATLIDAQGFTQSRDITQQFTPKENLSLVADDKVAEWQRQQSIHASGTTIGYEAGYQYFANWMLTKPGGTSVGLYKYRLPKRAALPGLLKAAQTYSVYIAKQPGDTRTTVRAELRLPENTRIMHTVPQDGITQTGDREVVYRSELREDKIVGVVIASQ